MELLPHVKDCFCSGITVISETAAFSGVRCKWEASFPDRSESHCHLSGKKGLCVPTQGAQPFWHPVLNSFILLLESAHFRIAAACKKIKSSPPYYPQM